MLVRWWLNIHYLFILVSRPIPYMKWEEKYEERNVCLEVYVTKWEMLTRFCKGHKLIDNLNQLLQRIDSVIISNYG